MNEKYGTTIVLTTHDMSDIEELCHRIIIIDKGTLLYDGGIDKIRKDYGYERKITFDLRYEKEDDVIESLGSIYQNIEGSTKDNLRFIVQDNQAVINFNRNEISISSIMNFVLHNFNVLDFSVQDMDIEAIVKQIYTK
jgi:ABC-2 type transport system ATP-binding protein